MQQNQSNIQTGHCCHVNTCGRNTNYPIYHNNIEQRIQKTTRKQSVYIVQFSRFVICFGSKQTSLFYKIDRMKRGTCETVQVILPPEILMYILMLRIGTKRITNKKEYYGLKEVIRLSQVVGLAIKREIKSLSLPVMAEMSNDEILSYNCVDGIQLPIRSQVNRKSRVLRYINMVEERPALALALKVACDNFVTEMIDTFPDMREVDEQFIKRLGENKSLTCLDFSCVYGLSDAYDIATINASHLRYIGNTITTFKNGNCGLTTARMRRDNGGLLSDLFPNLEHFEDEAGGLDSSELVTLTKLRNLRFSQELEEIGVFKNLTLLETLCLDYSSNSYEVVAVDIKNLTLLRNLHLRDTSLKDENLVTLTKLENLSLWYFRGCGSSFYSFKTLIRLELLKCFNIGDESLSQLIGLQYLLVVKNKTLTDASIAKLTNLESLTIIKDNLIRGDCLESLSQLWSLQLVYKSNLPLSSIKNLKNISSFRHDFCEWTTDESVQLKEDAFFLSLKRELKHFNFCTLSYESSV
jgi:hypothetical protein